MRDFNNRFEDFDRDFARMKKWGIITSILSIAISLGVIGFIIWVIVALMRFFGVV